MAEAAGAGAAAAEESIEVVAEAAAEVVLKADRQRSRRRRISWISRNIRTRGSTSNSMEGEKVVCPVYGPRL